MAILVAEPMVKVKTAEEELFELEQEALARGMRPEELAMIRAIGRCPAQLQRRIALLKDWLGKR